jgi:WD40 repeat protein
MAVRRGRFVRLLEPTTGRQLAAGSLDPSEMTISPDGKTVTFSRRGKFSFWSPDDKTPLRDVAVRFWGGGDDTLAADPAFSPDGKKLAIAEGLTCRVLDVVTGQPAVSWPSYERFRQLAFSADGRTLFFGSISIDTATWLPRETSEDLLRTRFCYRQGVSADRTLCVADDGDQRDIVFDTRTGGSVARLEAPERLGPFGRNGSFSPRAGLYVMHDGACGGQADTLFAIPSGKRLWQVNPTGRGATECWSFSTDESRVAFFELSTDMIHVHDTATGNLLRQFAVADAWDVSLALSPNGNLVAVWTRGLRDVQIHDVRTGKRHRWLALQQGSRDRDHACLAWSPDNNLLAIGGLGNSVRLWDVASGRVRREFRGHQTPATCLAFSPDGRLLASGSKGATMLIWKQRR